jgi:molybdenum cofactor synthesis domain-containing protein
MPPEVASVNVSRTKGTPKQPVDRIELDDLGVVGDAHAGAWHRQVSLLSRESIDRFVERTGRAVAPGEFAENVTTGGLDLARVAVLDRLQLGGAEIEISQIGKKCHGDSCAIFREVGACVMPTEGLFARVIRPGAVRSGDSIEHRPRPLGILVITLSDRAVAGQYADRSGPRAVEILREHFAPLRWHPQIETALLDDDPGRLRERLLAATSAGCDLVFTLGGTGLGPRDSAPDVIAALADRTIPGIMEHIRATYGGTNPRARLSRSMAALAGTTQIYALPGSPRAVAEYLAEILATWEHAFFMIQGLDVH